MHDKNTQHESVSVQGQLAELNQALESLHEAICDVGFDTDEKCYESLRITNSLLGTKIAIVSRVEADQYTIVNHHAEVEGVENGMSFPLSGTYCSITLQSNDVVMIDHMATSEHSGHPCYQEFQLETYIGVPIHVRGKVYGTLNFSSPEPRTKNWTPQHSRIVKLLGRWIGSAIERRQQTELLEAERDRAESIAFAKSQFLANMSHEIRTPMNGVIGIAQVLESTQLDQKQRELVKTIIESGDTLLDIVNDILDYSKLAAGQLRLSIEPFNVKGKVESIIKLLQPAAGKKGVDLLCKFDPSTPDQLEADAGRVGQILLNLVGNAIKFTDQGSIVVKVDRSPKADRYRFSVTDTGKGIASEALESIFDPFSQEDASTSRKYGGTGLGLAICKKLAVAMNGDIGVQSELGVGSTFWIEIPMKETPVTQATGKQRPDTALIKKSKPRALIAEDNTVNAKVLSMMLEDIGFSVEVVENGQLAVEAFKANEWDVVFMDCQMPVLDGYAATGAIRQLEKDRRLQTPIIAVTAHAMSDDRQKCIDAGMSDYISKPVKKDILIELTLRWTDQ